MCSIQTLFAQNSINGTITDQSTGDIIPFAAIYFPQLEKGSTSDIDGQFTISNIPNGSQKIIVSLMGYKTYSSTIVFPTEEILNIQLTPSAIEMEEIIISTPFHKLQNENVVMVERETVDELKSKGAISLADGLTTIPGVDNISTGMGIGKPVIRGLSANRVLVYTQGVRLENQQFGDEHGLGINDAGIESVEVIKGPASLLYGSDALGGVLYLNPEKFAEANDSEVDLSGTYFTNTEGFNTSAAYKASGEQFKFLFRGSMAEHSDYETADYQVTNTRFNEKDFKAGVGFQESKLKTELRYNVNVSSLGLPEAVGVQSDLKTPLLPFQEISNHVLSSKSTLFFENSSLELNMGFIYNDRKEFEDHHHGEEHEDDEDHHEDEHDEHHEEEEAFEDPALHMKLKTFNYDLKYHLPRMGKFETIVGVQGMNQQNSNYGEEELIPDATTNDIGVLAMSHIHFEKADIQLGLRYDHRNLMVPASLERNFNSINGALGIKTDLMDNLTLRINLASGFRAPNLSELTSDGTHEGTNRYEIGNSDLDNEQNIQLDLALEFANEHFEVFANGFYNTISNFIYLSPNGEQIDGDPVFLYLQDNAKMYGGEIGVHLHPHPLDWLHIESNFQSVIGQLEDESYLPLIPANSINNTLRVEFNSKKVNQAYAFFKHSYTFEQNNVNQFESTTNGYGLISAGVGGNLEVFGNQLGLRIVGTNLTDKTYINHLSRLKSDGIFNIGRNFSIYLSYTL